jgi:energy-coupling factor transporter transmembrane protein EcfT
MNGDKKIKNSVRKGLLACLIVSVLFVAGIPMIVVGFGSGWQWLGIPGVIFTAGGFFTAPILWTFWGVTVGQRRLCLAIEEDGLLSVEDLARNFGRSAKGMRAEITTVMNKRWLTGYKFSEDKSALIAVEKKTAVVLAKCPTCSAPVPKDAATCPYCGIALR